MTGAYWQPTIEMTRKERAWQRRLTEDAVFQQALAKLS